MLNNGAVKTVVALLPAIVAVLLLCFIDERRGEIVVYVSMALLIIGGVLAGYFLTRALGRSTHIIVKTLVFLLVLIGYVGTFAFTGCLAAVAQF